MKHQSTRALYAYWNEQRRNRRAPDRADIDPAAIRHTLGDTFMLASDFADQLRFRLAGTKVCALFCREIKGEAFNALWNESSVQPVEELLTIVANESVGAVAGLTGRTDDGSVAELEILLLPLVHAGRARVRALGVMAPLVPPYWLGEKPLVELELGALRHIGPQLETAGAPRFGLAPVAGRQRHGFMVYNGGREVPSEERTG